MHRNVLMVGFVALPTLLGCGGDTTERNPSSVSCDQIRVVADGLDEVELPLAELPVETRSSFSGNDIVENHRHRYTVPVSWSHEKVEDRTVCTLSYKQPYFRALHPLKVLLENQSGKKVLLHSCSNSETCEYLDWLRPKLVVGDDHLSIFWLKKEQLEEAWLPEGFAIVIPEASDEMTWPYAYGDSFTFELTYTPASCQESCDQGKLYFDGISSSVTGDVEICSCDSSCVNTCCPSTPFYCPAP